CQMAPAIFDTVAVDMLAGADGPKRTVLRANGSTLIKPGYISVYQEGLDDAVQDDSDHVLPPIDVRVHHLDASRSSVRRYREPPIHRDGYRQDRQPIPDPVFHHLRRLR